MDQIWHSFNFREGKESQFSCVLLMYVHSRCNPYCALLSEYQDHGKGNACMTLLKSCIFPLTISIMRTSTHEHRRLGKQAVGVKTTSDEYTGNTAHITETTQMSAN